MIKVIKRDYVQVNPVEVVEEVTVSEKILLWDIKTVYRKVHGSWFKFRERDNRYQKICFGSKIKLYLHANLPIEE